MKILKIALIIAIAFITIISCADNKKKKDGHGHEHGVNGEHLDDHGYAHDEHHTQETFEVTSDSLSKKSEENKPKTQNEIKKHSEKNGKDKNHGHSHDGENGHKY